MTATTFERRARARLRRWVKRSGYDSPEFEVRFDRSGGGGERSLVATVKRSDEVVDANFVVDYPGEEEVAKWTD